MEKKTIYDIFLVVLIIANCVLLYINISYMSKDADDKASSALIDVSGENIITLPEAIITNPDLKDFCENTLVPVLREIEFDSFLDVVKMSIKEENNSYTLYVAILEMCPLDSNELPNGSIEAFCQIEGFPIKMEFPENCTLVEMTSNKIEVKKEELTWFGLHNKPEWIFHMEGDSLVCDEVLYVSDSDTFEGKVMNLQTGRLE